MGTKMHYFPLNRGIFLSDSAAVELPAQAIDTDSKTQ